MPVFPNAPQEFTSEEEARFRRYLEQELEDLRGQLRKALDLVETAALITVTGDLILANDDSQVIVRDR